jgi:hypothetical protein
MTVSMSRRVSEKVQRGAISPASVISRASKPSRERCAPIEAAALTEPAARRVSATILGVTTSVLVAWNDLLVFTSPKASATRIRSGPTANLPRPHTTAAPPAARNDRPRVVSGPNSHRSTFLSELITRLRMVITGGHKNKRAAGKTPALPRRPAPRTVYDTRERMHGQARSESAAPPVRTPPAPRPPPPQQRPVRPRQA